MIIAKRIATLGAYMKDLLSPSRVYISDVFKSNFERKVLISYLVDPFIVEVKPSHSNFSETLKIAEVFHAKGYQVDIVKYNGCLLTTSFLHSHYDVVFGLEPNFLEAVRKVKPKISIYYATGAHYKFQNAAEQQRLQLLYGRRGKLLSPRRFVKPHESSSLADAVICIGNGWTKSTYEGYCQKIEGIRISAYSFFPLTAIERRKNWKEARTRFLWFGSSGAVHKGLDILLDIFKKHKELELYVCGDVKSEKDFVDLYKDELFSCENIHLIGWVNPDSPEYEELVERCAFTVLPSCSEGMNGAVPTGMHSGLIPLVSLESGLDLDGIGCVFPKNDIATIEKVLLDFSGRSAGWIRGEAEKSFIYAKENYTLEIFEQDFRNALEQVL